jgi:hypothetical protein
MSSVTCVFVENEYRRFGFVACPSSFHALIPWATVGTYLLLAQDKPIYVGRSDKCLRSRLSRHELIDNATHVVWEPFQSPLQAYVAECAWYHELTETGMPLNAIHPARPQLTMLTCPFCVEGDIAAWEYCMQRRS